MTLEIIPDIKQRVQGTVSFFLRSGDLTEGLGKWGTTGVIGGVVGGHVETVFKSGVLGHGIQA